LVRAPVSFMIRTEAVTKISLRVGSLTMKDTAAGVRTDIWGKRSPHFARVVHVWA
jgi:hypothetical protein